MYVCVCVCVCVLLTTGLKVPGYIYAFKACYVIFYSGQIFHDWTGCFFLSLLHSVLTLEEFCWPKSAEACFMSIFLYVIKPNVI